MLSLVRHAASLLNLQRWKHRQPILFHIDDRPITLGSFIQSFIESPNVAFTVIGVLAFGIGMMNVNRQSLS